LEIIRIVLKEDHQTLRLVPIPRPSVSIVTVPIMILTIAGRCMEDLHEGLI
jgi:hypothetical protein